MKPMTTRDVATHNYKGGPVKDFFKALKIRIVAWVRDFIRIEREIAQMKKDISLLEQKNLERDEQYPMEDSEALPPDGIIEPGTVEVARVRVDFLDGNTRTYSITLGESIKDRVKEGGIIKLEIQHPDHSETILTTVEEAK